MSRPGVTYTELANAASKIIDEGNIPTLDRIRAKLGTGSYSTLSVLLKEWKAKQALQQQYAANSNLPDELVTAVQKVWETINEKTGDQLEKIRQESASDQQILHQEILQQKQITAELQTSYHELNEKYRILSNDKSALEKALQEQEIKEAVLLETHNSFEKQLAERQERIEELTRLNQQIQNNLEHYRQASREQRLLEQQQYEARQNELEQRNHKLQESWTTVLTENTRVKSEFEQLFIANEKLQSDYISVQKKLFERIEKLNAVNNLMIEKNHLLQLTQTQKNIDLEKIDSQQNKIIEVEKIAAATAEKNKLQEEKIMELLSQNKMLAHEKWLLDCEKIQLISQIEKLTRKAVVA